MSIPEYVSANFNTLLRAAAGGDLALMEWRRCLDRRAALRALCHRPGRRADHVITPRSPRTPQSL